MHNSAVTSTDDVLVIEDNEFGLELCNGMHGLARRSKHVSWVDVFIVYPSQS